MWEEQIAKFQMLRNATNIIKSEKQKNVYITLLADPPLYLPPTFFGDILFD